jgi:hypothetical protein
LASSLRKSEEEEETLVTRGPLVGVIAVMAARVGPVADAGALQTTGGAPLRRLGGAPTQGV